MDIADIVVPERDMANIELMVSAYREGLLNMYRVAYLQGQIEVADQRANRYAEHFSRRDVAQRHEGLPEHDLDVVGRAMRAGH